MINLPTSLLKTRDELQAQWYQKTLSHVYHSPPSPIPTSSMSINLRFRLRLFQGPAQNAIKFWLPSSVSTQNCLIILWLDPPLLIYLAEWKIIGSWSNQRNWQFALFKKKSFIGPIQNVMVIYHQYDCTHRVARHNYHWAEYCLVLLIQSKAVAIELKCLVFKKSLEKAICDT